MSIDPKTVTEMLKSSGEGVQPSESNSVWTIIFEINLAGFVTKQPASLVLREKADYFVALSLIDSPKLAEPLAKLPLPTTRTLLLSQGQVGLAKIDAWAGKSPSGATQTLYLASSMCSSEGFTGKKLRARMVACAELAVITTRALEVLP